MLFTGVLRINSVLIDVYLSIRKLNHLTYCLFLPAAHKMSVAGLSIHSTFAVNLYSVKA